MRPAAYLNPEPSNQEVILGPDLWGEGFARGDRSPHSKRRAGSESAIPQGTSPHPCPLPEGEGTFRKTTA